MRGDGRVFSRGNRWWIAYYVKQAGRSVEVREPGGKDEKDALKLLTQRRKEVGAQDLGLHKFVGPASERVTVEELVQHLEQQYEIEGCELTRTHSRLKHVRAFFGCEKAVRVTAGMLNDYIAFRRQTKASNGSINRELHDLRRAFSLAVEQGRFARVHMPEFPSNLEENIREGFTEWADFLKILSHLAQDPAVRDYVAWGFFTGMRLSAIRGLTWAAFDKETWTLRLPAKLDKARKGTLLALEGDLREIMQRRLSARRLDCVFIFHRHGKPITSFRKLWKSACAHAGVAGLRFHDLRRTAARNLVGAGVAEKTSMLITGHRTRSMFDRYNIVDDRDLREAVLKTQAYLATLNPDSKIVALPR